MLTMTMLTMTMLTGQDTNYRPFPDFGTWQQTPFHSPQWQEATVQLLNLPVERFTRVQNCMKRKGAVETGVIEGLYPAQPHLLASAGDDQAWQSAMDICNEGVAAFVKGHQEADDEVQLFAVESLPISEMWIRQLHVLLCRAQPVVEVQTPTGRQQHRLLLGAYKHLPNHVLGMDGRIHAYLGTTRIGAKKCNRDGT